MDWEEIENNMVSATSSSLWHNTIFFDFTHNVIVIFVVEMIFQVSDHCKHIMLSPFGALVGIRQSAK